MPLLSLWQSDPDAVKQLTIEQVVTTAGDGRLRDNSECQKEFREFLSQSSVSALGTFADYCLENAFPKSGQALQDIVNELGRRLEYQVVNGRYQGTKSEVGFDGIWNDPDGQSIVVEVKTTDAYRLSLDTIAGYRDQLVDKKEINPNSSLLLVVGRNDTGELEAQVRGSRHAWDIRLVSVDALIKLVQVKESADSQDTITKIRKVLTPIEYTRIDQLIDVMFTAAQDVESAVTSETSDIDEEETDQTHPKGTWNFTPSELLQEKRETIITAVSKSINTHLVKKTRATYWDSTHSNRVVCTISKRYDRPGALRYWYAYHPSWNDFLQSGTNGYLALGCMDLDTAYLIPVSVIQDHLHELYVTEKKDGSGHYWHLQLLEISDDQCVLRLPSSGRDFPMEQYKITI